MLARGFGVGLLGATGVGAAVSVAKFRSHPEPMTVGQTAQHLRENVFGSVGFYSSQAEQAHAQAAPALRDQPLNASSAAAYAQHENTFAGTGPKPRTWGNALFDVATPARVAVATGFGALYDWSRR